VRGAFLFQILERGEFRPGKADREVGSIGIK
jgi:hypothetical protein